MDHEGTTTRIYRILEACSHLGYSRKQVAKIFQSVNKQVTDREDLSEYVTLVTQMYKQSKSEEKLIPQYPKENCQPTREQVERYHQKLGIVPPQPGERYDVSSLVKMY